MPCVRVPWLLTRLVVDYFAYVARLAVPWLLACLTVYYFAYAMCLALV
jgi:hypothetical protein